MGQERKLMFKDGSKPKWTSLHNCENFLAEVECHHCWRCLLICGSRVPDVAWSCQSVSEGYFYLWRMGAFTDLISLSFSLLPPLPPSRRNRNAGTASNKLWYASLSLATLIMYSVAVGGLVLMAVFYTQRDGCTDNKILLGAHGGLCLLISLAAISPCVQNRKCGFPFFLYVFFLCEFWTHGVVFSKAQVILWLPVDGLKSRPQSLHGYLEVMTRFTLCPGRSELKAIPRKTECTMGSFSMGMSLVCEAREL